MPSLLNSRTMKVFAFATSAKFDFLALLLTRNKKHSKLPLMFVAVAAADPLCKISHLLLLMACVRHPKLLVKQAPL